MRMLRAKMKLLTLCVCASLIASVTPNEESHQSHTFYLDFPGQETMAELIGKNVTNENFQSLWLGLTLFNAAKNGHYDLVNSLINHGANVNVKNKNGWQPIHAAAATSNDREHIVELLIRNGADFNARDDDGNTTLHTAALYGNSKVLEILEKKGVDFSLKNNFNQTAFWIAVDQNHDEVVNFLMKNITNVDMQDKKGRTPLIIAASKDLDRKNIVEILIRKGANVNHTDNNGNTPLLAAIKRGNKQVAGLLIENGANVNLDLGTVTDNIFGCIVKAVGKNVGDILKREGISYLEDTFWMYSFFNQLEFREIITRGDVNATDLMIKNCLTPNQVNEYKIVTNMGFGNIDSSFEVLRPLHFASGLGKIEIMKLLIQNGAKINYDRAESPLHTASDRGTIDSIKFLLENGADVNGRDNKQKTPLHIAADDIGNMDVIKFLLENGADINSRDDSLQTPLHIAAYNGKLEVVKTLIRNSRIDVNARDKDGHTPLYSARNNYRESQLKFYSSIHQQIGVPFKEADFMLFAYPPKEDFTTIANLLVEKGAIL